MTRATSCIPIIPSASSKRSRGPYVSEKLVNLTAQLLILDAQHLCGGFHVLRRRTGGIRR
jgi:hypothetical protein